MPVALVTGGTKGIGAHICARLVRGGCKVAAMSRSASGASDAWLGIPEADRVFVRGDVTAAGSHRAALAAAEAHFGAPVDRLVCNAGVFGKVYEHVEDTDRDSYDRTLAVNLTGVVLGLQEFASYLRGKAGVAEGSAVVIKSIYGSAASQLGNAGYFASKHGVKGVVSFAAVDLARPRNGVPRVRVNSVSPGFTPSNMTAGWRDGAAVQRAVADMHPTGEWTSAESVANAVHYLLSDEAASVTGHDLFVDQGVSSQSIPRWSEVSTYVSPERRAASDDGGGRRLAVGEPGPRVLVWCLSNNRASKNRGLARLALRWLLERGVDAEEIDPETEVDVLPPFREHLEVSLLRDPESSVSRLRRKVAAADALLICTPTYNASVPGVAKNAIDWLSRGCCKGSASPTTSVLIGKVVAHCGVGWGDGTFETRHRALDQILQAAAHPSFYYRIEMDRAKDVGVNQLQETFDEDGNLTGESREKWYGRVGVLCQHLLDRTAQVRSGGPQRVAEPAAAQPPPQPPPVLLVLAASLLLVALLRR